MIRRLRHLDDAADLDDGIALGDQLLGSLELADDLFRRVPGPFHGEVPGPVWPDEDSHSPWTDCQGPRQRAKQASELIREAWAWTSWIVEVTATGRRDGMPFQATHLFLTSLRTTPQGLLQRVRDRWSIEGWQWIRDTQLHEDAHRYRGNGAGAMATLRTAALNLLRLAEFQSIRSGMQAVMHDITALLAMARRRPKPNSC